MTTHIEPKRGVAIMREAPGAVIASADGTKPILFRISDGTVDRYNSTVDPAGWDFANFIKNPVVCWQHNSWGPPIGRSGTPYLENGAVFATVDFDVDDFSKEIEGKIRRGFLSCASVSWDPIEWSYNKDRGEYAIDYKRQELLEWSPVTLPGNANAIVESRKLGIPEDVLRRRFAPILEEALSKHGAANRSQLEQLLRELIPARTISAPGGTSMSVKVLGQKRDNEGADTGDQPPFKEGDNVKIGEAEYPVKSCTMGYIVEVESKGQSAYMPADKCTKVDGGTATDDDAARAWKAAQAALAGK